MRMVNTRAHGIYDYLMGFTLIACPSYFNFLNGSISDTICIATGITLCLMSFFTKYEFGFRKILKLKIHLALDVVIGAFLALSPWLFNFHQVVYKPHVVFGLTLIIVSILTDRTLYYEVMMAMAKARDFKAAVKPAQVKKHHSSYFKSFLSPYKALFGRSFPKGNRKTN